MCPSEFTYRSFAEHVLRTIEKIATRRKVHRIDIVTDTYESSSIKAPTRQARGMEAEVIFHENDRLQNNFAKGFLSNNENKIKLNSLIQKVGSDPLFWNNWTGEVVISHGTRVWSIHDGPKDIMRFIPEVHEEADNRIVAHVLDVLSERWFEGSDIIIRTGDTDVVVILVSFYGILASKDQDLKVWVEFGTGKSKKCFAVHAIAQKLGIEVCGALMFFHSFTGADATCALFNKSKAHWFKLWMEHPKKPDITEAFKQLSWTRQKQDVTSALPVIEQFVCSSYGFPLLFSVNDTRLKIFSSSTAKNLRQLPPSRAALELHILRSAYQSGCVWGNTLTQEDPPNVKDWGWTVAENGALSIQWTVEQSADVTMTLSQLVKTCKCKKSNSKCTKCGCGKLNLSCMKFCSCRRSCVGCDNMV